MLPEQRRDQDLDGRARRVRVPPLLRKGLQQVDRGATSGRRHGGPVGRQGRIEQGSAKLQAQAVQGQEGNRAEGKGGKKQEAGPAVDAVCAAKQKVGKGKDAAHKATTKVQAGAKTSGAKVAKPRAKPEAQAGFTLAKAGSGENAGKTGSKEWPVEGRAFHLPLGLPQFEPGFYGLL